MDESVFGQLKGYINELEKLTKEVKAYNPNMPKQAKTAPTDNFVDEYNAVLEQEFISSTAGRQFAERQFELAQKHLIMMFMDTPEGKKLSEERTQAFKTYKDGKMKEFLESRKSGQTANTANTDKEVN